MPKTKETRVALKGENPKKAPKISETARKVPRHTEEIQNVSDSEGSTSESSSGHSSGSESDAEKRKNTKKPKPSKVKETEPNSPPVPDDSSDESSSDESEQEKKSKAKKAPAAVDGNDTAKKTEDSLDESSSESESESDEEEQPAEAPRAAGQGASQTTATAVIPPQPFAPPPGYKPVNTKTQNASTLGSLFDPKSLSSKQVWHITAPSSVPLSEIKSVSLSAIQSHQTVLSHRNTDYNFAEEPSNNARVLVPSSKSEGYAAVEIPISKTLNLQQTVRLPSVSSKQTNPATGSNAAAKVNLPSVRGPRPQPKGLRMRCKPPGFGDEDPGIIGSSDNESDSDVSMAEAPATGFKQPSSTYKESRAKRKREEAAEASPAGKKRRKAKEAEDKLVEGTKAEIPETAEEKERKKKEKKEKKKKDKSSK